MFSKSTRFKTIPSFPPIDMLPALLHLYPDQHHCFYCPLLVYCCISFWCVLCIFMEVHTSVASTVLYSTTGPQWPQLTLASCVYSKSLKGQFNEIKEFFNGHTQEEHRFEIHRWYFKNFYVMSSLSCSI
jgi:hypothetical protein